MDGNKHQIKFVNFTRLPEAVLEMILEQRNRVEIRKHMVNSEIISLKDHLSFCESLKTDKTKLYFLICFDRQPVGVVDYVAINSSDHSYEPGIYFFAGPERIHTDIDAAALKILLHYELYHPKIKVKKENTKALLYNLMKLGLEITREDDEYVYMTSHYLNPSSPSFKNIPLKLEKLAKRYELVYEL
jgi:hypothetical protein